MVLTNESYVISISTKNFRERYYRDRAGWLKISARGRKFRMTAEQVLNHILPAFAGLKPGLSIKVNYKPKMQRSGRRNAAEKTAGPDAGRPIKRNLRTERRRTCRNRSS